MLGNMGFGKLYFKIIDRASAMFSIEVQNNMLGNMGFGKLYFKIIDRASAMFSINVLKFLMRHKG